MGERKLARIIMSFNQKTIVTSFLICLAIVSGLLYYKKTRVRHFTPIPPRPEVTLTIIPGWNLRQVADYLVKQGFASTSVDVYKVTGEPAVIVNKNNELRIGQLEWAANELGGGIWLMRPYELSFEGYLAPETFRVFKDATLKEVLAKFLLQRDKEITDEMRQLAEKQKKAPHQILIVASLVEDEAKTPEDRRLVSDILWRRYKQGMALQLDSSVHYAIDKTGDVYTTNKERSADSFWNTYKYPGLPPGPICNPSIDSIKAALSPVANNYWYFLSGKDGQMHYARTLDEHNLNVAKYLRK